MTNIDHLKTQAKELYGRHFATEGGDDNSTLWLCSVAPGRVNLIGEHVDYTGGFVFPIAIGFSTVVYGSFSLSSGFDSVMEIVSDNAGNEKVVSFSLSKEAIVPFEHSDPAHWANYVMGVVLEYLDQVLAKSYGRSLSIKVSIVGDVPLGSGLSSSAALEVAIATFLEGYIMKDQSINGEERVKQSIERAVKCQHAENTFCGVPCGIMDQFVSSAGMETCALLIDCESNSFVAAKMGPTLKGEDEAVIVVTNSNVKHSHANGEYPVRVQQCREATETLQSINESVSSLRHAKMVDLEQAKPLLSDVIYRRAKHVITENERTLAAKVAFESGDMSKFGELMNGSHKSMKNDYEVSCVEIDFLVDKASSFPGVFGSRLTGGGFGGCTVTLVAKSKSSELIRYLKSEYEVAFKKSCDCFVTSPGAGARLTSI